MACLFEKITTQGDLHNNDIYAKSIDSSENLYEEPHEKKAQEEQGPQEKNMRVFFIN